MQWMVGAAVVAFLALLSVWALRRLTVGRATIHIAHMKSREDAQQVAEMLKGIRGVVEARVELEQHLARVTYRRGRVAIEEIMRALHAGGF